MMRPAVRFYVYGVSVVAGLAILGLWGADPVVPETWLAAAACFVSLGLLTQAMQYQLATGAAGSIAFIPFLTIAALYPNWASAVAVGLVALVSQLYARRPAIKLLFNVAQFVTATALAIAVYRLCGGGQAAGGPPRSSAQFLALGAMFATFMAANWVLVSFVVAIHEGRRVVEVWLENSRRNLFYDLLSFPLLYLFIWLYAKAGAPGALALALPILGLRQLYRTNWLLEQTNQELLQLMVAAIEARDPYTSGHSKRVAHYSKLIARALGLNGKTVERVGVAALLHDVGKIHEVFAPILRKEGPLTPEERALMETHSVKSAELVANVSQLKDLVEPIRHHHENWDGSGYPDGLAGESIPLAARVIMVADTIDAMTTDRPYRKALGPDDVRAELQRCSGQQFDPRIVEMLLESTFFLQLFERSRPTPAAWRTAEMRAPKKKATA